MPNVYQFKDFEGSSHRILLDLVRRFARRRGMLLDLGAAGGELGEALRGQFDRSIGIEHDLDRIATVWASTPWEASTTSSAPSQADSERLTSYEKSTCPGVSIRLRL